MADNREEVALVMLSRLKAMSDAPRREVKWTEDQKGSAGCLLAGGIIDCAETSRRGTTYLQVGDRTIQVKYRDVTDDLAVVHAADIAEMRENLPSDAG